MGSKLCKRGVDGFSFGKFLYMTYHVADFGQYQPDFAHKALITAFPKVLFQGFFYLQPVFLNRLIQFL